MKLKLILIAAIMGQIMCCSDSQYNSKNEFEISYYESGNIKDIVEKDRSTLSGKAFRFDENGSKVWEWNYINGLKDGKQLAFVDGQIISSETFVAGVLQGWATYYTNCGKIAREGTYSDNKLNGLWYEYYNDELLEIDLFKNDSIVKLVYRNSKYTNHESQLPPIESADCCCRSSSKLTE